MPTPLVPLLALAPSIPGLPSIGSFGSIAAVMSVPLAGLIYLLMFWGKHNGGECSWREDEQIGLKLIVGTLIMVGTVLFASGLQQLLHLLMTFNEFVNRLKALLPDLIVGGGVLFGALMVAVPKTNHEQQPKVLRLFAGAIALFAAVAVVIGFDNLIEMVFARPGWKVLAGSLTSLLTSALVFAGSGYLYAKMAGIELPDIPMPAQAPDQQQYQQQQAQQQYQQQQYQQQQAQQQYQQPAQQQYQQPAQQQYQQPQAGGYPQQGGAYPPAAAGSAPPRPGGPPAPGGGGYPPSGYGQ